jgi:hypothetical protein
MCLCMVSEEYKNTVKEQIVQPQRGLGQEYNNDLYLYFSSFFNSMIGATSNYKRVVSIMTT